MFGDTDAPREDLDDAAPVEPVEPVGESPAEAGHEADDAHPTPPVTGDEAVDEAMMQLARSQAGSFAERIESGEHAHRSLQSRLGGLGGA